MLFEAFRARAAALPATSGLRTREDFQSYQQLVERAERAAGVLAARGVEPGMAVALLIPNSPDFFVAVQACFAVGAVAVPVGLSSSPRELDWVRQSCGIGAAVAAPNSREAALHLAGDTGMPVIEATADGLFAAAAPRPELPPVSAEANAAYLFSSGSTGRAKVVPHTHAELHANGIATTGGLKLTPDDVILNALPGHHAFGFMNAMTEALAGGATTLFWSDPQPLLMSRDRLLATLVAQGVTVLPGVPFLFDTLVGSTEAVDIGHLRLVYSSGVGMRRPVYDRFRERFGLPIRQAYGSTETGHIAANLSADEALWDSVGLPVGEVTIEILPIDGTVAPGTGEILIRSPATTRGYLDNDSANAATFVGGGFLSGDLGRVDEHGHVFITGRSKLILEVSGQKIDPVEIEDVLAAHPAVEEAVVVGVPNPRTGEQRLKAVVVRRGEATADALLRHSRGLLSAHKVPEFIEFRDQIPRSAAGKVLRGKLMED
jgi:acyl-CoA synthetase (AMP-forming)/AMP-acid ligase II